MLYLTFSGYSYSKRRCERVVNWFVNEYLPRHKILINVDHKGLRRENIFGWMWAADCDHRPRDFEIELHAGMKPDLYIETLLHELWHLYQHVHGSLRDKHGKRFWRGVDHSKTNYDDQPWEKEAYAKEKDLVDDYFIYLSDNQLPL